jgi:hypothetical protein
MSYSLEKAKKIVTRLNKRELTELTHAIEQEKQRKVIVTPDDDARGWIIDALDSPDGWQTTTITVNVDVACYAQQKSKVLTHHMQITNYCELRDVEREFFRGQKFPPFDHLINVVPLTNWNHLNDHDGPATAIAVAEIRMAYRPFNRLNNNGLYLYRSELGEVDRVGAFVIVGDIVYDYIMANETVHCWRPNPLAIHHEYMRTNSTVLYIDSGKRNDIGLTILDTWCFNNKLSANDFFIKGHIQPF